MEENFRNTLIIISAIIIGAFFVHGIWTIRKNKNPYKLKTKTTAKAKDEKVSSQSRDFDRSGFDQDGVGQVKVKNGNENETLSPTPTNSETPIEDLLGKAMAAESKEAEMPSFSAEYNEVATESVQQTAVNNDPLDNPELESILKNAAQESEKASRKQESKQELKQELKQETKKKPTVKISKPLYQEPVIHPKPSIKAKTMTKAELKRDQIEINFGIAPELDDASMPNVSVKEPNKTAAGKATQQQLEPQQSSSIQPEVLSLSVVMPANQIIHGAALLPSLLTLGLKYGEMNIFHRHQDNAGNGSVTFSLANMMNPGSFDLDTMETFATQGITLFMMLPNMGNAFEVYEQMLAAAKQLSQEFQAQVLDDKRNIMTKQTEQHYVSRIREFEIKNRTASV